VVSDGGKRLDVDVHDVAVVDSVGNVPTTVSFQMSWHGTGRAHRRGRGLAVGSDDPRAFLGRLFSAKPQGTFSGVSGAFTFTSDPKPRARTIFGLLGTEQTGALIPGFASCDACAHGQPGAPGAARPW
jgi:hypothetical protein